MYSSSFPEQQSPPNFPADEPARVLWNNHPSRSLQISIQSALMRSCPSPPARVDDFVRHRREPRDAFQFGRLRGHHIAARGLPIHTRSLRDDAQFDRVEPASQHFPDLFHTDPPESQRQ